jgi:streptomycin 6-kinase
MIAAVLARAGLEDSARSLLAHIQEQQRRDPNRQISGPLGEAYVYLLLNERDSAITQIAAYLSNATAARKQIAQHPWFRALHGDQRFEALVRPSP